ncbi:MAG: long-chain fatty acid transport protein [Desulforhopalus sp.]|jgi:long-chain fatty acid transport protein
MILFCPCLVRGKWRVFHFFILTATVLLSLNRAAFSAGYQIPNQSNRAVGIAGATIAYTTGPDASYYNPANMAFLDDVWMLETSLTMLYLPSIEYTDNRSSQLNGSSESEMFYLPQIHLSSKDFNNFRFGFSLTYPYGLAKRWDEPYPAATAKEFSLDVIELNPTFSYALGETLSLGGGLRFIYSEGTVENGVPGLTRELEGDDLQVGYNLAATYRPIKQWRLAATYRSEVTLDLEGDATMMASVGEIPVAGYNGSGSLEVTLPAVFSLATSYSLKDVTLEVAWNRTLWSGVEDFDFQYDQSFLGTPFDGFDRPLAKSWDDSDALRFGLTWAVLESLDVTLGFAIDETPVQENTLGFELPDSDAYMYTAGLQYDYSKSLSLGISYMYHHTTTRSVSGDPVAGLPGIDGTFKEGGAHAVNVGTIWRF